jgi:hypothetical protein
MSLQYNQNVPISSISLGEQISQLPVDKIPSTPTEMNLVEHLFKKNQSTFSLIFEEAKDSIIVGILVILFCIPSVDTMIQKLFTFTQTSLYFLLTIKALLAGVLYWLIRHFYLSRAK